MARMRKVIPCIKVLLTTLSFLSSSAEAVNKVYQLHSTSNTALQDSTNQISKLENVANFQNCAILSHKDDACAFTFASEGRLCVTYRNKTFNVSEEIDLAKKYHNFQAKTCQSYRATDYYVSEEEANWATAKLRCEQRGCYLTEIRNVEEQRFINEMVLQHVNHRHVWIGGQRNKENTFVWYHDNTGFSSSLKWEPNQPNGQTCVELYKVHNNYWMINDIHCHPALHFVCKC